MKHVFTGILSLTLVLGLVLAGCAKPKPPAVQVVNNSGKLKAKGASVIPSGQSAMVTGFEVGGNTNQVKFASPAWLSLRAVSTDMALSAGKLYEITVPAEGDAIEVEKDGSGY